MSKKDNKSFTQEELDAFGKSLDKEQNKGKFVEPSPDFQETKPLTEQEELKRDQEELSRLEGKDKKFGEFITHEVQPKFKTLAERHKTKKEIPAQEVKAIYGVTIIRLKEKGFIDEREAKGLMDDISKSTPQVKGPGMSKFSALMENFANKLEKNGFKNLSKVCRKFVSNKAVIEKGNVEKALASDIAQKLKPEDLKKMGDLKEKVKGKTTQAQSHGTNAPNTGKQKDKGGHGMG